MKKTVLAVALALALVAAACGGSSDDSTDSTVSSGSDAVAAGQAIFESTTIGTSPGCVTCHSVEPGKVIVGPSLAGIAPDAAGDAEEEGISTEEMLKVMITDPEAEVVEGFPANTMPKDFATQLSEQELDQLIAYLMTLT